jgi:restriction endonuclease
MKRPSITIRYGATHNSITVDGKTFELSTMTKREKTFLRKVVVGALFPEKGK